MNRTRTFDRALERWLEAAAPTARPAGLHQSVIKRAATMRQRPAWVAGLRDGAFPGSQSATGRSVARTWRDRRLAFAVAAVVVAVGAGLVLKLSPAAIGGPSHAPSVTPSPSASVDPWPVAVRAQSWTSTGSMVTAREGHTATLLPDGKVLVTGGVNNHFDPSGAYVETLLASAELYDPASGTWTVTGSMGAARAGHTATLLANGKVLVAGGHGNVLMTGGSRGDLASAELYDPATGTWTATGNLTRPRGGALATLLPNGKVLVVGGAVMYRNGNSSSESPTNFAELYDPATGTWTATKAMVNGGGIGATLVADGEVLVAGAVAQLYDGKVLVAGGVSELYDPSSATWSASGNTNTALGGSMATLLPNGKVLMACGCDQAGRAAELYDPTTGSWTATGTMVEDHWRDTADWLPDGAVTVTLLADGRVLVAGGGSAALPAAELYDPATGVWAAAAPMVAVRVNQTATLLPDGEVLVAGGNDRLRGTLASAELYDPGTP